MKLGVNIDHVATVREARKGKLPDPIAAAVLAELAGADQITVHLREDARHIKERDVRTLKDTVSTGLNLEMGLAKEIIETALDIVPHQVTIVPERREELTTEGGLDVIASDKKLSAAISKFHKKGIAVNLFIEPNRDVLERSKNLGVDGVEIHTGAYANAGTENDLRKAHHDIHQAAVIAKNMRMYVAAGHGLDYTNISAIAKLHEIEEVNIGHSIISRAMLVGLERAVREMKELL